MMHDEPSIPISMASAKLDEIAKFLINSASLRFVAAGHSIDEAKAFAKSIGDDLLSMMETQTEAILASAEKADPRLAKQMRHELDERFGTYL